MLLFIVIISESSTKRFFEALHYCIHSFVENDLFSTRFFQNISVFLEFLTEALVVVVALGILGEPAAQDAFLLGYGLMDTPEA